MNIKRLLFLLYLSVFVSTPVISQADDNPYLVKVSSQDSIIHNLYKVISGDKGQQRDWDLFRYLFVPDARLIPTGLKQDGGFGIRSLSVEEYIETSGNWLVENGFFENEIARQSNSYGSIAQVFSSYESFRTKEDAEPFMRGINSIQLFYDGDRWWITTIFWMTEVPAYPLPESFDHKN